MQAKTDQTGRMPRLICVFAGRTVILLVLSSRGSCLDDIMHANSIMDPAANLLICHMILVGNVQKFSKASCLKGFGHFLKFCYKGPALIGIKKGDKMSVHISLTLQASDMVLSLYIYVYI